MMKYVSGFLSMSILLIFTANGLVAQTTLRITKTNNTYVDIPLNEVLSITFMGGATPVNNQTVVDIEGNVYKTVQIGHQVWMAENLRVTKYNDGKAIDNVRENAAWAAHKSGAYSWYANNSDYKDLDGAFYNFYAVESKKLCPDGWHVPDNDEWNLLLGALSSGTPGALLKEAGTTHWKKTGPNVTNESGFTALPSGTRTANGAFVGYGTQTTFWTATINGEKEAFYRAVYDYTSLVIKYSYPKEAGLSVRCIRD